MHRNRTWQIDPTELRTQRNRILPIEGGDGSTLNLDFTTGVLDPRLTFSRASTATFVNSSGYVDHAGANLLFNTAWTTTSLPAGWNETLTTGVFTYHGDGSITCAVTTAGRCALNPTFPYLVTSQGLKYTYGFTVVAVSGSPQIGNVILSNQTVETVAINGVTVASSTVVNAGDIVSCTFTADSTSAVVRMGIGVSGNLTSQSIRMTQPRANPGLTLQSYLLNPNTAAGIYAPRFDYSPTNIGEPRGLLIEGQGINVLKSSEEFSIALGYAEQDIVVPRTSGTSPSGGTAVGFYPTTVSGYHRVQSPYLTGLSGAYTVSIWYKRLNSSLRAGINANAMLNVGAVFDLNGAGSVVTLGGSAANKAATITAYPNDWYRVTVTGTRATDNGLFFFMAESTQTDFDGGTPFVGVASQGMLMWGAQLEADSGASSYIPTGASQVTRNPDDCYIIGTNFSSWYNPTEGSLFIQWTGGSGLNLANGRSYTLLNATQTNQIFEGSGFGLNVYLNSFQAQIGTGLGTGNSAAKVVSAFKQADFATSVNGSNAAVQSSGSMPTLVDRLSIGGNYLNAAGYKFACIKQIKYYPVRLSNAQLKSLSTP